MKEWTISMFDGEATWHRVPGRTPLQALARVYPPPVRLVGVRRLPFGWEYTIRPAAGGAETRVKFFQTGGR